MDLFKPGTKFDFVGKRWIFGTISGLLVLASMLGFFLVGPNWGIDFTGGTEVLLQFKEPVEISEVRQAVAKLDLQSDAVQQLGDADDHTFSIRIKDPEFGTAGVKEAVENALTARFGEGWIAESTLDIAMGAKVAVKYNGEPVPVNDVQEAVAGLSGAQVQPGLDDNLVYVQLPGLSSQIKNTIAGALAGRDFEVLQVDSVGPAAGAELRNQGIIATIATLALVVLYVAFRFDFSSATGAVISVIHDTVLTAGYFVLSRDDFNLPSVGALLTIVGYSINDKIVVYDRIRENVRKYRRRDLKQLINESINEILSRSIYTSVTVFVALSFFVVLGGPVIQSFATAILLGVVIAAYSTVYVASPVILILEDLRPHLEKYLGSGLFASSSASTEPSEGESKSAERRRARDEAKSSAGEHTPG
jgi:preprotein translocase subunit SecF